MKFFVLLLCYLISLNAQPASANEPQTRSEETSPIGDIHLKVGLGLFSEKKYQAASDSLRLALKQSPTSAKYRFYLSRCLHQLALENFYKSKYSKALPLFEEALQLKTWDPNTKYALRKTLEKLNLKQSKVLSEIESADGKECDEVQKKYACILVWLRHSFITAMNRRIHGSFFQYPETDKEAILEIKYDDEKRLLSEVKIARSSGDKDFDQAALDSYKRTLPLRFKDLIDGEYTLRLYFDYKLQANSLLENEETKILKEQEPLCMTYYSKGQNLMLEKKYKEAISEFEKCRNCALPVFKMLVDEQLGDCLVGYANTLDDKNEAKNYFRRALILQPDNIHARSGIKNNEN